MTLHSEEGCSVPGGASLTSRYPKEGEEGPERRGTGLRSLHAACPFRTLPRGTFPGSFLPSSWSSSPPHPCRRLPGGRRIRGCCLPGPPPPQAFWPRPLASPLDDQSSVPADWLPLLARPSHFRVPAPASASPGKTRRGPLPLAGSSVGLVPVAANRQQEEVGP